MLEAGDESPACFQDRYEGCAAIYGPNTQSTCAGAPGLLVCECFP